MVTQGYARNWKATAMRVKAEDVFDHSFTKWRLEKRRKDQLLIVSTRWFAEYGDGSAGAKYQIRLKASAFRIALPGKPE